jgi:hypothetical protein
VPPSQATTHDPPWQTGQLAPHWSQLALSLPGSTQSPPQQMPSAVGLSEQEVLSKAWAQSTEVRHWPYWQEVPVGQASPQAPQLEGSNSRSTHAPPQHSVTTASLPSTRVFWNTGPLAMTKPGMAHAKPSTPPAQLTEAQAASEVDEGE